MYYCIYYDIQGTDYTCYYSAVVGCIIVDTVVIYSVAPVVSSIIRQRHNYFLVY